MTKDQEKLFLRIAAECGLEDSDLAILANAEYIVEELAKQAGSVDAVATMFVETDIRYGKVNASFAAHDNAMMLPSGDYQLIPATALAAQQAKIAELEEQIAKLKPDAERYQFLRHCDLDSVAEAHWPSGMVPEGTDFDAAIDAERNAK